MTTRKYAKFRDSISEYYECTNDKCKWIGKYEDKKQVPNVLHACMEDNVCPKCGNNEFYQITQEWAQKNIKA